MGNFPDMQDCGYMARVYCVYGERNVDSWNNWADGRDFSSLTVDQVLAEQQKAFRENKRTKAGYDKNGKEIYEGDILSNNGEVFYEPGEFVCGNGSLVGCLDQDEIIGNIYQNPELLEQ